MITVKPLRIDAKGMHYTPLNRAIREAVASGATEIILDHVMGQRFIADGLRGEVTITINGVPGGDLGMFMSGPTCIVYGNCEHAPGNTMDSGQIIIHGNAGDAVAHSMRGGKIFVRDNIGYRGGIHMKQYLEKRPILIIGGSARAFLGEYMAGGLILVLGRAGVRPEIDRGIGSGIHGGMIVIRGGVKEEHLGVGAKMSELSREEFAGITPFIREFSGHFCLDPEDFLNDQYFKVTPASARPFASKYTWEV
jgi:glutamate synthase domain-containing protein 3